MPKRESIARVACEACRMRKIRCDGTTPACNPCQSKRTQCVYSSNPNVSRFAAVKSKFEHLKASHGTLLTVYEKLKNGSALEAAALLERIRSEDRVPDISNGQDTLAEHSSRSYLSDYENGSRDTHWEPQTGFSGGLGQEASLRLNFTEDLCTETNWRESVESALSARPNQSCVLPPFSPEMVSSTQGNKVQQMGGRPRRGTRSDIGVSHRVLLWPEVARHIMKSAIAPAALASDLHHLSTLGSPWLLHRETSQHRKKLPSDAGLLCSATGTGSVVFPDLTIEQVNEYCSAYFNTFNMLLPLLDQDLFLDGIITRIIHEGYREDDPESVLSLLVFALGQLAIEGVMGQPTTVSHNEPSGFRGGTIDRPPGLHFFNEARRRIGMISTHSSLENVQSMLLQATYFEASARHSDFCGSITSASSACISLIKCQQIDWSSTYGDLVKRAFWTCVLQEGLFDLEFRVISTGIEGLEDKVPLPHFHAVVREDERTGRHLSDADKASRANYRDNAAFHFLALITLSRLIRRADNFIHGHEPEMGETELLWQGHDVQIPPDAPANVLTPDGAPSKIVQELFHQLERWRNSLPQHLQWSDGDRFGFEEVDPLNAFWHTGLFSSGQNLGPGKLDHNVDVATAQLRTRFYHARFLICRPFVYKALHSPTCMSADDRFMCAVAINAACFWPLSLAPPKNKKHLVPHLFSWTQNFLAMIFVLRMCRECSYLASICDESGIAEEDIEGASKPMAQWLEDVRQVDGIADWYLGPKNAI